MAKVLTLSQLTSLVAASPVKAPKIHGITLERIANINTILADASAMLDVTVERNKQGEQFAQSTILAAYRREIKKLSETDRALVTVEQFGDTLALAHPDTFAAIRQTLASPVVDEVDSDENETDESADA